jgi:hypothetical protein
VKHILIASHETKFTEQNLVSYIERLKSRAKKEQPKGSFDNWDEFNDDL